MLRMRKFSNRNVNVILTGTITRLFLVLMVLVHLLFGCKSINSSMGIYDDIGFTIYNGIENYYYSYLKYPDSVYKLTEYLWEQRLIKANNYRYSSYSEYCSSQDTDKVRNEPVENAINFLNKNQEKITISIYDNILIMDYCDKEIIKMECNYCRDSLTPWDNKFFKHRFHTFDSDGKITKNDYEDVFSSIQRGLVKKYPNFLKITTNSGDSIARYFLLSYKKNESVTLVCPEDSLNLTNNPFVCEMAIALDSIFKKDKDVKSIVFLTSLRY